MDGAGTPVRHRRQGCSPPTVIVPAQASRSHPTGPIRGECKARPMDWPDRVPSANQPGWGICAGHRRTATGPVPREGRQPSSVPQASPSPPTPTIRRRVQGAPPRTGPIVRLQQINLVGDPRMRSADQPRTGSAPIRRRVQGAPP